MKSWLVAVGREHLGPKLLQGVESLSEDISIMTCHDVEGAMVVIQNHHVDLLIVRAHDQTVDCIDLIPQAFADKPGLKVAVLSQLTPSMTSLHSLTPCLKFISEPPRPDELRSLVNNSRPPCPVDHAKGLDAFLLVALLAHRGSSQAFRLKCPQGQGTLGFINGILVHAHTENLDGDDALQQLCLWDDYRLKAVENGSSADFIPNISSPVNELMANAASLRREFSGLFEHPPIRIEERTVSEGRERGLLSWWEEQTVGSPGVVRVLFGFSPFSDCTCVETISQQFAATLDVRSQWSSSPDDGPSFVRMHTEEKGLLSLTFVPMVQKNQFVFETFAGQSEAVVICDANVQDHGPGWKDLVPGDGKCLLAKHNGSCKDDGCAALAQLVEETG